MRKPLQMWGLHLGKSFFSPREEGAAEITGGSLFSVSKSCLVKVPLFNGMCYLQSALKAPNSF